MAAPFTRSFRPRLATMRLSSALAARSSLPIGLALLAGCHAVPSDERLACTPTAAVGARALRIELLLDPVAVAQPTVLRVATGPAPIPGASRVLVHRRAGTHTAAGPLGALTCQVSGRAFGRLALLDVLTDAPATVTVRRAGDGALLLQTPLPAASRRLDLRWAAR